MTLSPMSFITVVSIENIVINKDVRALYRTFFKNFPSSLPCFLLLIDYTQYVQKRNDFMSKLQWSKHLP